jgi:hypothetical protein
MSKEEGNDEAQKEEVLNKSGGEALDLDQIHERTLEDLEKEDNKDDEEGDTDNGANNDQGDDDSDEDNKKDNSNDPPHEKDGEEPPVPEPVKGQPENKPAPELEEAIGVEVKDYEGKVHKFKNFDELPDDFEPISYKEFARFTVAMNEKLANDKKREQDRLQEQAEQEKQSRIDQIKAGWDKDIEELTNQKALPNDEKEREKVVAGVFDIINEALLKDRVIDFAPAYEIYSYRQSQKQSEQKRQEQIKEKKEKGSKIQGQNSPTPSKARSYEAPPTGVSLDQVHEQVMSDL